jgi:hypothetical protein
MLVLALTAEDHLREMFVREIATLEMWMNALVPAGE